MVEIKCCVCEYKVQNASLISEGARVLSPLIHFVVLEHDFLFVMKTTLNNLLVVIVVVLLGECPGSRGILPGSGNWSEKFLWSWSSR